MKSLWNNFKVAFAMFSKIPMPRADWTKENMKYMFCFFPFIGTVIGGLTMLVAYLGLRFGYQPGFVTAVLVLVPVFVTGGIHVDGLLDTSDALSSWQERSRRLEILKDSMQVHLLLLLRRYISLPGTARTVSCLTVQRI